MKDNPELANMLLNGGAKINRLNPSGKTALHLALEQLTRPTHTSPVVAPGLTPTGGSVPRQGG